MVGLKRLLISLGIDNQIKIHSDHFDHITNEEREGFSQKP